MALNSFFDAIFGRLIDYNPLTALLIISFILTLVTTLAYKYLTDQNKIKALKDELKSIQEDMKKFKDDPKKIIELQKQSFQKGFIDMMKHQMKPLIITLVPLFVVFNWLRVTYAAFGDLIFGLGWFGIYFISAILFSMILRKLFRVY